MPEELGQPDKQQLDVLDIHARVLRLATTSLIQLFGIALITWAACTILLGFGHYTASLATLGTSLLIMSCLLTIRFYSARKMTKRYLDVLRQSPDTSSSKYLTTFIVQLDSSVTSSFAVHGIVLLTLLLVVLMNHYVMTYNVGNLVGDYRVSAKRETTYWTYDIFFGTNRRFNSSADSYSGERGLLRFGSAIVSVPYDHRMGRLERPLHILKFSLPEQLHRHVILHRTVDLGRTEWLVHLSDELSTNTSGDVLLFIHGYNTTFDEAARRTAQLTRDLGVTGAGVFFSWPSDGDERSYIGDSQDALWSITDAREFFETLFLIRGIETLSVVAHSLGTLVACEAIAQIFAECDSCGPALRAVMLAAPDIDAERFSRDIAPLIANKSNPITVYSSSHDDALNISGLVNENRRLGDAKPYPMALPGVVNIDASRVDTGFLGHGYYASSRTLLSDMYYNRHGVPPNMRHSLEYVREGVWVLVP